MNFSPSPGRPLNERRRRQEGEEKRGGEGERRGARGELCRGVSCSRSVGLAGSVLGEGAAAVASPAEPALAALRRSSEAWGGLTVSHSQVTVRSHSGHIQVTFRSHSGHGKQSIS